MVDREKVKIANELNFKENTLEYLIEKEKEIDFNARENHIKLNPKVIQQRK